MKYIKLFEKIKIEDLEVGRYYSFKSYYVDRRFLLKLIDIESIYYIFEKIEDLKYPPFRYYKGESKIDKFTIVNWIEEREFREELWFRTSEDPELWKNMKKYNV